MKNYQRVERLRLVYREQQLKRLSEQKINISELVNKNGLPIMRTDDLLPAIQDRIATSGRKIIVLDDDPTGTQTVHGIPVLTHWSVGALAAELKNEAKAFFLLTNSRSYSVTEACRLSTEIGTNLKKAVQQVDIPVEVISRSDSTLRGHFPEEVDALASAMGETGRPYLIIPCFFEGGRYTLEDVHYVAEGEWLVPAAETAYAGDAAFGFKHSNLRDWVEEKTGGRIPRSRVASISVEDIRSGGPQRVLELLTGLAAETACIVNAVSYKDLEVFVLGLLDAESNGYRFQPRTAASFVRVRTGIQARELLEKEELVDEQQGQGHGGLFVVGSYVPKTTAQISSLRDHTDIHSIEIAVDQLLDDERQADEIQRVSNAMNHLIETARDVVIYTSRDLVKGTNADESLSIGQRVSDSLIRIIKNLQVQPRYLVAKGGITSSDWGTNPVFRGWPTSFFRETWEKTMPSWR